MTLTVNEHNLLKSVYLVAIPLYTPAFYPVPDNMVSENSGNREKVVLAYSGGLDTSVAIKWLQDKYNLDVIAVAVNVGQPPSSDDIVARALRNGAIKAEFVDAKKEKDGMRVEKFDLGSDSQFVLLNNPEKYPDFKVTNYHVNGLVWDNGEVLDCWKDKPVRENGASAGFLLSYGKFDWFTGGDAGDNGKVEKPTARAIGRQIEAMKGHHHMSWHTMTPQMLEILRPQVVVNQSFYAHQPWPETMRNVLTVGMPEGQVRDVFLTNLHDSTYVNEEVTLAKVKAYRGHVVIRVLPGGDSFYVYMLDDSNMEFKVKSVYGPYECN